MADLDRDVGPIAEAVPVAPPIVAPLGALVRVLLTAAMGGLVARGVLTPDQFEAIVVSILGLLGILGMIVWAIMRNKLESLLLRAAESPKVVKIETTTKALAEAVPSPKVVKANDLT